MKKTNLQERLDAEIKKTVGPSPSLIPRGLQPNSEPIEVVPDLREVAATPTLQMQIQRLVAESVECQLTEKRARDARKPITAKLKTLIESCSAPKFMVDGHTVTVFPTTRSTLSAQKLLDAGIQPHVISACTTQKTSYSLKITIPGSTDDDE